MIFDLKRYQLVVIDYPVFAWDDGLCQQLLGEAIKLKIEGYHSTYSDRVMPFDKADFFGTHLIFCEEVKDKLVPIFFYKSAPYDRCLKHNFEFPAFTCVKTDGHPSLVTDLNKLIKNVNAPEKISFDSSWAQNINYRFSGDQGMKERLREIMMMVIVQHHREFNLPHMLCTGVVKVKTDQFFLRIGMQKLNEHAHHNEYFMDGTEMVIFYARDFSPEALIAAEKYKYLWDKKLLIDGLKLQDVRRRSAA